MKNGNYYNKFNTSKANKFSKKKIQNIKVLINERRKQKLEKYK